MPGATVATLRTNATAAADGHGELPWHNGCARKRTAAARASRSNGDSDATRGQRFTVSGVEPADSSGFLRGSRLAR